MPGTGSKVSSCGAVSTILSALALPLPCEPTPLIFGTPSSPAVCGLLSLLPRFLLNKPCAFGALATLLNFLASSSLPDDAAAAFVVSGVFFFGVRGVSGGEGGILLSSWCRIAGGP